MIIPAPHCTSGSAAAPVTAKTPRVALNAIHLTSVRVGNPRAGPSHHFVFGADFTGQGPFWHNAFGKVQP